MTRFPISLLNGEIWNLTIKAGQDSPRRGHQTGGDPAQPGSILLTQIQLPDWLLYCIAMNLSGQRHLVDPAWTEHRSDPHLS